MSVEAQRFIKFNCEKCNKEQYCEDSLESSIWQGIFVHSDRVDCAYCGHTNHVYIPSFKN